MAPEEFMEVAHRNFDQGALVSPVVGILGGLRIAAGIVRMQGDTHGVAVLANIFAPQEVGIISGLSLRRIGSYVLNSENPGESRAWSVAVHVEAAKLLRVIGNATAVELFRTAELGLTAEGDPAVELTIAHAGMASDQMLLVNQVPLKPTWFLYSQSEPS